METFRNESIADGFDIHDCYIVGYTQGQEGFKYLAGKECISKFVDLLIERCNKIKEGWVAKDKKDKQHVLYVDGLTEQTLSTTAYTKN